MSCGPHPDFFARNCAPPSVTLERRTGGGAVLRSTQKLRPYARSMGALLERSAARHPARTFLAERRGNDWHPITYRDTLAAARAIGQALLERGLDATRPLMILSGNSIDHALMSLGGLLAGVPVAPVSPAYSLMSRDFAKLRQVFELVRPAMIFASPRGSFATALAALDLDGVEVVGDGPGPAGLDRLRATPPGREIAEAEAAIGPDTVAKYLFTSGSTGQPKGVINSHRMLCATQRGAVQLWPFLEREAPLLLDWLPWHHTFGGNNNFNLVMVNGGTLYIDAGKPLPGLIEQSLANMRDISPTIFFNVPAGYSQLLPHLERDEPLAAKFLARMKVMFSAGAALPRDLTKRLEALTRRIRGAPVFLGSGWGATETGPGCTLIHFPSDEPGAIGLPLPGIEIKMVPSGAKTELRVRGPNVMPGYLRRPDLTRAAFDADGFYRMGDAGRLADPGDASRGLVFDGRVAEDFKLSTGTWVAAGSLRVKALAAASPVLGDGVVTGHDRDYLGLLAWINPAACAALCGQPDLAGDVAALIARPAVIACVRDGIAAHNRAHSGSASRIRRVLLMAEPPGIDAGEITDKGYINQRATLERRAGLVGTLYRDPPPPEVIEITR